MFYTKSILKFLFTIAGRCNHKAHMFFVGDKKWLKFSEGIN